MKKVVKWCTVKKRHLKEGEHMKEDEMKALETVSKELCRLKEKYQKK